MDFCKLELMTILLTESQLDRLSEFIANLGLVVFASAITPLFVGIDKGEKKGIEDES